MALRTVQKEHNSTMATRRNSVFNFYTFYLFIRNYNVIILVWSILGTICSKRLLQQPTITELLASRSLFAHYWMDLLRSLILSGTWVFIAAICFSISNQRSPSSIQEDGINKPWRPIPSQRITVSEANTLLFLSTLGGFLLSIAYGGVAPYLIQLAAPYYYNDLGGSKGHHFIRDFLNAVGMTSWLYGCIQAAGGPTMQFVNSELVTSVLLVAAITTTIAIQDFRDIEGDEKCGRATFTIVIGHWNARVLMAFSIVAWSFGTVAVLNISKVSRPTILDIVIAVRLLFLQNRDADKITMEFW